MSVELSSIVQQPVNILNRPMRVATFGDSTANLGGPTNVMRIPFPESGSVSGYIAVNRLTISAIRPFIVCSGGIGGETTAQMLARGGGVYSTTRKAIKDIIDFSPDVVLFFGTSVNDVATYVSETYDQYVVDSIYSRHKKIADILLKYGIPVIDVGCYGYSASVSTTLLENRRRAIMSLDAKTAIDRRAGYAYVPMSGVTHDNGNIKDGFSDDGIHLNSTGTYYSSAKIIDALNKLYRVAKFGVLLNDWEYDFANHVNNIPLGYSVQATVTGVSNSCSIAGLDATFTSDGTQQYKLSIPIKTYISGFGAGKKVLCSADIECISDPSYVGKSTFTSFLYRSDNASYVIHGNQEKYFIGADSQSLAFELGGEFGTSTILTVILPKVNAGTHTFRIKNVNVWDAS